MTVEQFKATLKAAPFRPFSLRTGDGSEYRIDHPERAMLTSGGRTVVVETGEHAVAILDLLLVHAIEFNNTMPEIRSN